MRALAIAFVSASLLALPAAAQQQNQGNNGLGNVLRNLNQAISPNGDQNGRGQQQNYGDNENEYNGGSGSSTFEPRYRNGRMVLRNQSDVNAEQQRLNDLQAQLNQAQQRLNREQREFDQAQRNVNQ